jgi:hypothetical protein
MSEINKKMIAIMNDIDAIEKNKTNVQQNYKFRGIDDMYNAIHPLFKKNGVFILSEVLEEKREERQTKSGGNLIYSILRIKFSFNAEDGSSVFSTVTGEGMDSGDKASNKAMSTALKYALMQTFLIPTKELNELNTENETHEVAPKKTAKEEAAEKLAALPENIKDGFKALGFTGKDVYGLCAKMEWDNDKILAEINKVA